MNLYNYFVVFGMFLILILLVLIAVGSFNLNFLFVPAFFVGIPMFFTSIVFWYDIIDNFLTNLRERNNDDRY